MNPVAPLPPRRTARVHPDFWTGARLYREGVIAEAMSRGDQPLAHQNQLKAEAYRLLGEAGHDRPAEP